MNIVLTITGPSASGKSYLEDMLVKKGYAKITSHTSRMPRNGEVNGREYHFCSREIFEQAELAGEFVEVVEFGGNLYGGSLFEFDKAFGEDKPVVVVCEPNGRDQIQAAGKEHGWTVLSLWIESDAETLADRMVQRLKNNLDCCKPEQRDDVFRTHASRLAAAMNTELAWRAEADDQTEYTTGPYDLMYFQFDETTDVRIVESILHYVELTRRGITTANPLWEMTAGIECGKEVAL